MGLGQLTVGVVGEVAVAQHLGGAEAQCHRLLVVARPPRPDRPPSSSISSVISNGGGGVSTSPAVGAIASKKAPNARSNGSMSSGRRTRVARAAVDVAAALEADDAERFGERHHGAHRRGHAGAAQHAAKATGIAVAASSTAVSGARGRA